MLGRGGFGNVYLGLNSDTGNIEKNNKNNNNINNNNNFK